MAPPPPARADVALLFAARSARLFSYGSLTVCLLLFLEARGLSSAAIGALLTAIFVGDLGITLALTNGADAWGRRRTLLASAGLKTLAGVAFASTANPVALAVAGIVGVISPAGGEIGPFLAVEQAALAEVTTPAAAASGTGTRNGNNSSTGGAPPSTSASRTAATALAAVFGWYNAAGYAALAAGALASGGLVAALTSGAQPWAPVDAYAAVLWLYAGFGVLKAVLYSRLSPAVETADWRAAHGLADGDALPAPAGAAVAAAAGGATDAAAEEEEGAAADAADADADDDVERAGLLRESLEEEGDDDDNGGDGGDAPPPAARPPKGAPAAAAAPPPLPLPEPRPTTLAGRLRAFAAARFGLRHAASRRIVARLSTLFAVDAFAGGFVMQSVLVRWFAARWGLPPERLGALLMAANVAAGVSSVGAGWLVARIGAVPTMVWTHLPSNVLLAAVPLMPTAGSAVALLLARFCLSQMDVPARQAFVAASVAPEERSAAAGITNVVRSLGVALAPAGLAWMAADGVDPASARYAAPFWVAGALKCAYDLTLYAMFARGAGSSAAAAGGGGGGSAGAEAAGAPAPAADSPPAAGAKRASTKTPASGAGRKVSVPPGKTAPKSGGATRQAKGVAV